MRKNKRAAILSDSENEDEVSGPVKRPKITDTDNEGDDDDDGMDKAVEDVVEDPNATRKPDDGESSDEGVRQEGDNDNERLV